MNIKDVRGLNKYKKLVDKLKANSDGIEHTEAPIKNSDVLKLLEISKTMTKTEAIQFAVKFTIDNFGMKFIVSSQTEAKLEKLRYAQKEGGSLNEKK